MTTGWRYTWAMSSVAFGGASLIVPLYVVDLGGWLAAASYTGAFVGGGLVPAGAGFVHAVRRRLPVDASLSTA